MILPLPRGMNRLVLRMVAPAVLIIALVGVGLYAFVLRAVADFADDRIAETLSDVAKEVYDICDANFTALMQSGRMSDARAVTVKQAFTVGAIEDYVVRNGIGCRLTADRRGDLLLYGVTPDCLAVIESQYASRQAAWVRCQAATLYFNHFIFKPWGWHIDLVSSRDAYGPLITGVKRVYVVTGVLLLLGLVLILALQERLLRRPLNRIIAAIGAGRAPDYTGVRELEFLSDSVAAMMRSLDERNAWIQHLYRIAVTHRGDEFFNHVAAALAEALALNTLLVRHVRREDRFVILAFAPCRVRGRQAPLSADGLPHRRIAEERRPLVIQEGAAAHFPAAPILAGTQAETYAGVPIVDREGVVVGIMSVFGDQRVVDQWCLSLIETVGQMVAVELEVSAKERDRRRLEAMLQKSKKMEAIGTLAGGVAHDLNNILSGIVSYPDLLLMDLPPDSPWRQPIQTIKESGERAALIVQDLLTLARRNVAVADVVNLNTIIRDQLKRPEYDALCAAHPQMTLTTRLDEALLNVKGSATHLAKAVMNLIANAAEAMPNGGEIVVATENRTIDRPIPGYDQVTEGDYVAVTVADTGVGLSAEDRERIFEPFYTKKAMGRSGSGLGMAVVWGTVKDHHGYIDLESVEGRGTRLTLLFPVTREPVSVTAAPTAVDDLRGHGQSILVVDDVAAQRRLAVELLSRLDYVVHAVPSGEAAVDYLRTHTVDLLVLDMIMAPGMDGLETYRRVVAHHPGQRAIIASGYAETERVKAAQALGAGEYIKKPYTLEKIGLAVKAALAAP